MLDPYFIAQIEHRERMRDFEVRAARGEFIRYTDFGELKSAESAPLSERVTQLGRAIRHQFRLRAGRSVLTRPGVDTV